MALKSGSVVQARCGACRSDTRHVVVKVARGVVSRVRCRTCKREHAYKPKSAAVVPRNRPPAPPARSAAKPKPISKTRPAAPSKPAAKPAGKGAAATSTKRGPAATAAAAANPAVDRGKAVTTRSSPPSPKGAAVNRPSPPVREAELPPYEKALKEAENRAPETYRISGVYRERQRLQHGVFGLGVVTRVLQSNVFEAIFPDGPRKLAMAREEPKGTRGAKAHKPVAGVAKASPPKSTPSKPAASKPAAAQPIKSTKAAASKSSATRPVAARAVPAKPVRPKSPAKARRR